MLLNRLPEPDLQVIPYYSLETETTTYLVSRRDHRSALLVDPVPMDRGLYQLLLNHRLSVDMVFITHPEAHMHHALRTLLKIFDPRIVTGSRELPGRRFVHLTEDEEIACCDLTIRAIPFPSHSRSSFVYQLDRMVFTGSIVHAGTLGETANAFAEALLVATVKDFLFPLPEDTLMLPSVGPPTTIKAERSVSPFYRDDHQDAAESL